MKTLIIETPTFILGFVSDLLSQFSYVWVMSRALFVSLFKMKYEKERDWDWDWGETEKQLIFNFFFYLGALLCLCPYLHPPLVESDRVNMGVKVMPACHG